MAKEKLGVFWYKEILFKCVASSKQKNIKKMFCYLKFLVDFCGFSVFKQMDSFDSSTRSL